MCMNQPKKLNGWTEKMMKALNQTFIEVGNDPATKAAILTGTDPYYCAGVDLSATMRPMHPGSLFDMIVTKYAPTGRRPFPPPHGRRPAP